ncbi:hypothetical protein CEV32_1573 [Brucella rhizosphaerae]|uniref:Uncharacterized protein n=1 Tax=Brucella rhizosphaerae TaxID=571254 RepID=A0A256F8S9_9HYPH|nr:hypothetical protein CEV32_1573 [Brucella rhizosphaerae]
MVLFEKKRLKIPPCLSGTKAVLSNGTVKKQTGRISPACF